MQDWFCELLPEEGPIEDVGDYTRQRITIQTAPGYRIPLLVLRPRAEGPFKVVLAFHGHGYGKCDVCGLAHSDEIAAWQETINYHYAVEAVKRGYIVFAPDKRAFGEQVEERDRLAGKQNSCEWHNMSAMLLGMTQIGLHVWDNQRLLDFVTSKEECRSRAVACLGVSGGGQATLWLAALDERVKVAIVSGHLGSFSDSILLTDGCSCNAVPGLLRWAKKGDVGGLIAPRPLLIESGSRDDCYSRDSQMDAYRVVKRAYQVAGVPERVDIDLFEGPHQWSGRKAWHWLASWL
jgi:dienelactone hydrolase